VRRSLQILSMLSPESLPRAPTAEIGNPYMSYIIFHLQYKQWLNGTLLQVCNVELSRQRYRLLPVHRALRFHPAYKLTLTHACTYEAQDKSSSPKTYESYRESITIMYPQTLQGKSSLRNPSAGLDGWRAVRCLSTPSSMFLTSTATPIPGPKPLH
jgi:hypothetical protein